MSIVNIEREGLKRFIYFLQFYSIFPNPQRLIEFDFKGRKKYEEEHKKWIINPLPFVLKYYFELI